MTVAGFVEVRLLACVKGRIAEVADPEPSHLLWHAHPSQHRPTRWIAARLFSMCIVSFKLRVTDQRTVQPIGWHTAPGRSRVMGSSTRGDGETEELTLTLLPLLQLLCLFNPTRRSAAHVSHDPNNASTAKHTVLGANQERGRHNRNGVVALRIDFSVLPKWWTPGGCACVTPYVTNTF